MKRLVSERRYHHAISFEIVKEWENIFAEKLHTGIICVRMNRVIKLWNRAVLYYIPFITNRKKWRLGFIFSAGSDRPFRLKNVIPIYIDFHPRVMDKVIYDTRKLPCFFVTSLALCNMIREKSGRDNCYFVPLSLPDQYIQKVESKKDIDVLQIGRKNEVLHNYMLRFCERHPEVTYVFMGENFEYISAHGLKIGRVDTREEYFELLRRAKISLVSSPGRDKSSRRYDEKVDFFTPRFYESAAARCFLVGRYTANEESRRLGIERICTNVGTYEEFEEEISKKLVSRMEEQEELYLEFLQKNSTSRVFEQVIDVLQKHGFQQCEKE